MVGQRKGFSMSSQMVLILIILLVLFFIAFAFIKRLNNVVP